MTDKKFAPFLQPFAQLIEPMGGCIASDYISVKGYPVRFMYRTAPHNEQDSGWNFLSGMETDDDMADASRHQVFDVNTIANWDRSIIPHLSTPANCAFEKLDAEGEFEQVFDFDFGE